jgi:hypothetical protein
MRTLALGLLSLGLLSLSAFGQDLRPDISNAQVETRALSGSLDSALRSKSPAWFGYAVKTPPENGGACCWDGNRGPGCGLEGSFSGATPSTNRRVELEGSTTAALLFRVQNDQVEKIQVFSLRCPLDAGGLPFVWLNGVSGSASLSFLKTLANNGSSRVQNGALFAISRHEGQEAVDQLIALAKSDASSRNRSQALFWLAQRADKRAAATITDAIENDPDTKVKRQAVFALSQLPKEEGVPKLIQIARTQKNPEVRKQAFFWLGQSNDPRAIAFFDEVLKK